MIVGIRVPRPDTSGVCKRVRRLRSSFSLPPNQALPIMLVLAELTIDPYEIGKVKKLVSSAKCFPRRMGSRFFFAFFS